MEKYESKYEMLNKVAAEYWIYGEYGDGFGKPRYAFFTPREANDLHCLSQAGKSKNLSWGRSDLKLGELKFTKFLDCKHVHRNTDLQVCLSEQVFVLNNTLGPGIGYTPHQLVLGMSSGVPGIYEVPESDSSKFARSLNRIKLGINKSQVTQPPSALGDSFPYEPDDFIHFLGPRGRIGLVSITGIFGKE